MSSSGSPVKWRHTSTNAINKDAILFNDSSTADVILRLSLEHPLSSSSTSLYLHSHILQRSNFFSARLSDRWMSLPNNNNHHDDGFIHLSLTVPSLSLQPHLVVLELLYTDDFAHTISAVSTALDLLPVASELLFEECISFCVAFIESVPWNEEEERRVLEVVPRLHLKETKELLARVSYVKEGFLDEMVEGLVDSTALNNPNEDFLKAFVAEMLRDSSHRDSAKRVLVKAFDLSLMAVKKSLEKYVEVVEDRDYIVQNFTLERAMTNGIRLVWLLEGMIQLRVADNAVKEWGDMRAITATLTRAFWDNAWRNVAPHHLPGVMLNCTFKLAHAVAGGHILATTQVRRKLVEDWLPILKLWKAKGAIIMLPMNKSMCVELEEIFLRIISTLPMSDSQELLLKFLRYINRNVEECPHLVTAFKTWSRRAAQPFKPDHQW